MVLMGYKQSSMDHFVNFVNNSPTQNKIDIKSMDVHSFTKCRAQGFRTAIHKVKFDITVITPSIKQFMIIIRFDKLANLGNYS